MSASPSPGSDPGTTVRRGAKPSTTTQLSRFGPRILLGGLAVGCTYAWFATRAPKPKGSPEPSLNPFRTTGVQNVEKAYANGGATKTHQPAYGGSTQGSRGADGLRQGGGTGLKDGMDSEHVGEEQRPVQPSAVGEKFHEMKYGSKSGK